MAETTINYASKYSDVIDERFKLSSVTTEAVNNNYDFSGVNTVYVYSAELAELGDYNMSAGSNRYGTPKELGNRVQELKLSQDKAFTFTIDRRNSDDTMMTQQAAKCLQRHIDEIVVPTMISTGCQSFLQMQAFQRLLVTLNHQVLMNTTLT